MEDDLNIQKMQHDVIRHLLSEGGSDIQMVDGHLCEIRAQRLDNETVKLAVKQVVRSQENASTSD